MGFKKCTMCEREWGSLDAFLSDPALKLIGYQVNFLNPKQGLLLFQHDVRGCKTSLGVKISEFYSLYPNPIPPDSISPGLDGCKGYCKTQENLLDCTNTVCVGHLHREVMLKVRKTMAEKQGVSS